MVGRQRRPLHCLQRLPTYLFRSPSVALVHRSPHARPPALQWGSQTLVIDVDCNPIPTDEEEEEEEERERVGTLALPHTRTRSLTRCCPPVQAEEDEEQPEGGMDGYRLLVTVVSGEGAGPKAGTLQFGCMVTDHLRVHKVATYPAGSKVPSAAEIFSGSEENPSYGGPNFEELDQAVQNGFYEYLAERGIDDTLAEKLGDFAASKEQAEYITWLETTKAFVQ